MATKSIPLSDFPAEMLTQIAETIEFMYPPVIVRSESDIKDPFEVGRAVGKNEVAEAFRIAASKSNKEK